MTNRITIFAVTAPGLEHITAGELGELGISDLRVEPGGVEWDGTAEQLYAANLQLRTASRVLVRVAAFKARTFFELERHARKLPWDRYLSPSQPLHLRVTSRKSRLYHEGAIAERLLQAAAEAIGPLASTSIGKDTTDDEDAPAAQTLVVRFFYDRCTLSVDSSGELLHRRGYRQALGKAPLRETLAAAMLLAGGWRGQAALLDPMCGSGTIPIEAALLARKIAPGLASPGGEPRAFAFERWPDFDRTTWARIVDRARDSILPATAAQIYAFDRDAGAVQAATANAARAGVESDIRFGVQPLSALESLGESGLLLTNPPYGVRVGEREPLRNLYAALGRVVQQRLPRWSVGLLSATQSLESQIGLRFEERFRTRNGGIPIRFVVGDVPNDGS